MIYTSDFDYLLSRSRKHSKICLLYSKKGENLIKYDPEGLSAREAFLNYDTLGKISPTRHPNVLSAVLCAKKLLNLDIKMYADSYANHLLTLEELYEMLANENAPVWVFKAVLNYSLKFQDEFDKYYNLTTSH